MTCAFCWLRTRVTEAITGGNAAAPSSHRYPTTDVAERNAPGMSHRSARFKAYRLMDWGSGRGARGGQRPKASAVGGKSRDYFGKPNFDTPRRQNRNRD